MLLAPYQAILPRSDDRGRPEPSCGAGPVGELARAGQTAEGAVRDDRDEVPGVEGQVLDSLLGGPRLGAIQVLPRDREGCNRDRDRELRFIPDGGTVLPRRPLLVNLSDDILEDSPGRSAPLVSMSSDCASSQLQRST